MLLLETINSLQKDNKTYNMVNTLNIITSYYNIANTKSIEIQHIVYTLHQILKCGFSQTPLQKRCMHN